MFSILAVVLMALTTFSNLGSATTLSGQAPIESRVHITDKSADVVIMVDGTAAFDRVSSIAASKNAPFGLSSASSGVITLKASGIDDSLLAEIASVPGVKDVSSVLKARTMFVPNDPEFSLQWGVRAINATGSWDITRGNHSVVVAELDTGIDWNHPDLIANIWSDSQGYHGYNFIANNRVPMDDNVNSYDEAGNWQAGTNTYHGTHVAGIIAAGNNTGMGVAGMAQILLMAVKVMNDSGEGTDVTVSSGLDWAVDHGADIVTMSLGVDGMSSVLQQSVVRAAGRGVVMVAASGNNGDSFLSYPAAYPQVIAVGAIDASRNKASFSNWGNGLEIMAPGDRIYSTQGSSGYQYLSGTSTATPYVAGVAALMLSVNPGLTPARVREVLNATATDMSSPNYDVSTGWGLVDAFLAVESVSGPSVTITGYPSYVVPNGTFSITWLVSGSTTGNPGNISRTYLERGTSSATMIQQSRNFTGRTWEYFTTDRLASLPYNGTVYVRAVATIDGTEYVSSIQAIPVHKAVASNPFTQFIMDVQHFIFNDLGIFNFALLLAALIAIPAILIAARSRRSTTFVRAQPGFQAPVTLQNVRQAHYVPPPPPPPPRFEAHLDIIGHEVTPSVLRVKEGTKVVWVNRSWAPPPGIAVKSGKADDAGEHPDGAFQSGLLIAPGDYWSATFHRAGTYEYYLTNIWRSGKIVVEPYSENGTSVGNM